MIAVVPRVGVGCVGDLCEKTRHLCVAGKTLIKVINYISFQENTLSNDNFFAS